MTIQNLIANTKKALQSNSPQLFTAFGIAGVASTAYLAARAGYKAGELIDWKETNGDWTEDRRQRFVNRAKLTWTLYIPPVACGVATVGCICGLSRVTARRATAAATAYAIAERGFDEYREKVEEQLGKGKEQKIRDNIAQDKVNANPPSNEVMVINTGLVLCCELFTHRYFRSDMETLRKAEDSINERIYTDLYVMLSEFYTLIGLPHTSHSDYIGWEEGRPMKLVFTTTLSEAGEPCIAFDYNYAKPLA